MLPYIKKVSVADTTGKFDHPEAHESKIDFKILLKKTYVLFRI
jgi:hypothetical protein